MLKELESINRDIEGAAAAMEQLVGPEALPDRGLLAVARLRLSRSLRRHLVYIDGVVMPRMESELDAQSQAVSKQFRITLHQYHEAAAHHVGRWSSADVTKDWGGYRASVREMLIRLRTRIALEKNQVHPLVAGLDRREPKMPGDGQNPAMP